MSDVEQLAIAVLVRDLGYTLELPPRYGWHPMRHQNLWRWVKKAVGTEAFEAAVKHSIECAEEENELPTAPDPTTIPQTPPPGYCGDPAHDAGPIALQAPPGQPFFQNPRPKRS